MCPGLWLSAVKISTLDLGAVSGLSVSRCTNESSHDVSLDCDGETETILELGVDGKAAGER